MRSPAVWVGLACSVALGGCASKGDLRRVAPYVSERMIGGAFCATEGKANPLKVTPAFARARLARKKQKIPSTCRACIRSRQNVSRAKIKYSAQFAAGAFIPQRNTVQSKAGRVSRTRGRHLRRLING